MSKFVIIQYKKLIEIKSKLLLHNNLVFIIYNKFESIRNFNKFYNIFYNRTKLLHIVKYESLILILKV